MPPHHVGDLLERARLPLGRPPAELRLGAHDRVGVEQVGQLRLAALAEQLGQQRRVERQRGGPALGQRGVAVVEELRGVAEQQRLRERRRLRRRHLDHPDPARHDVPHERR